MKFDLSSVDSGSVAWVLAATALVMLMTPGLAFFYGGMVRAKGVLAIILQGFATLALVCCTWAILSFSLAFGKGNGLIGGKQPRRPAPAPRGRRPSAGCSLPWQCPCSRRRCC